MDAVAGKELDKGGVNKLVAVVCLELHYMKVELYACIGDEVNEKITCVGFPAEWVGPHKMRKIINNDQIIFEAGVTSNR